MTSFSSFITTALQYAGYGIVFVVMISILVAAHEYGHYLFARMFNMGVEEFAIGFGKKPLFTWMRRSYVIPIKPGDIDFEDHKPELGKDPSTRIAVSFEGSDLDRLIQKIDTPDGPALKESTNFTVRPWPLGGFVRIKGMMPEEDGSEVRITGGFYNKSPYARFMVLLAGPLFSVLAGIAILTTCYMFDGKEVLKNQPIVGGVGQNRPSGQAGMKPGDRVVSIDGEPVKNFYQIVTTVTKSGGKTLAFVVERGGKMIPLSITPFLDKQATPVMGPDLEFTQELAKSYKIGVGPDSEVIHLPFLAALTESAKTPVEAVGGLFRLFQHPSQFSDTVSGPVTMVTLTANAVRLGIWKVLWLSAILSISVGVFNLLPAPPLDGGQMAMAVAEMFRGGRRLSIRAQGIASTVGLTFVFMLVVGALFVDLKRQTAPKEPPVLTTKDPKK